MDIYKYETHTHTVEGSRCASITAIDLVHFYKSLGYSGICVTDHFFNGNSTIPSNLLWKEKVDIYCRSFEKAYAEGKRIGLDVFFGWEYSYLGTDLLTYGLNREWLLNHPYLLELGVNEYCDLVHSEGGFIVHAHPFREAHYIEMIRLLPRKVDAVEVINACRKDFENRLADEYADNYHLLKTAGSDNHWGEMPRYSGIQLARPLQDVDDMIEAIKNSEVEIFTV
ncbi:MAG: histidinol phosphatase [Thermoclostridium sp.]|nr:histidinol phosphatase [Thermoclostridium sp.]